MQRLLSSCVLALAAVVSVNAQDTTIKSETRVNADDAKVVTVTGCLNGGPSNFMLTNVVAEAPGKKADDRDDKKPVGTSGAVTSYRLTAREGMSLAPHVGQKVELVGVVIAPAIGGDDDAKVEVRERTEVQREGAPDSKTETKTTSRVARGPSAQFAVASLKTVAPLCLE